MEMTETIDNEEYFWPQIFKEVDQYKYESNEEISEREHTYTSVMIFIIIIIIIVVIIKLL
jgi:hypothetical protein